MLGKQILRSLSRSARMTIWTLITLTTCASLVSMFTTISFDVGGKISGTLRQIGANAVAYSDPNITKGNHSGTWQILEDIIKKEGTEMARLLVRVGTIKGKPVAIVMADPEKLLRLTPYWAITGRRSMRSGECLVGREVGDLLQLKPGMTVSVLGIAGTEEKTDCRITGIIDSGDEDENRVFIPLPSTESMQGYSEKGVLMYALLSVPEGEEGIKRLNGRLQAATVQGIEVKALRQILYGEQMTLKKVTLLSGLSLMAVLILTALGVSSAVLARIAERRKELALMQAIGARRRSVVSFLLLEGAAIGIVASAIGVIIGTLISQFIVKEIFHTSVTPQAIAFLTTFIVTVGVSLLAGGIGTVRAMKIQPAVALKGE